MEEYDEELAQSFIEFLVEEGCMEVTGIDESGEFILSVTPKMEKMFPELWEEVLAMSNKLVYELWQKDLVNIIFRTDGEIFVSPNENTLNYMQQDLNEEQTMMMEAIVNRMNQEGYNANND